MEDSAKGVARRFLDSLRRRDFAALEECLADDVWFRALLPRKLQEAHTREETVAMLRKWYGSASELEAIDTGHHSVEGREFVRWCFRLKPDWAPEASHVIEQAGFCRVKDGRIRRLDVVCTGFHPVEDAKRRSCEHQEPGRLSTRARPKLLLVGP